MTTPPELLAQILTIHGDTLYRLALLIAGDERGAARLLRALGADLTALSLGGPLDEPELLALLVAVARREEQRRKPGVRPPALQADAPPLYRSLYRQPLDRKLAFALHLLLGYDSERLVRVIGGDVASARAALVGAADYLGPTAGTDLTDRVDGELCRPVRDVLVEAAQGSRQSAAVRGHLTSCSLCRSFDQAWGVITERADGALRTVLRERSLPANLRAQILGGARLRRGFTTPTWRASRLILVPLAVLGLIAAVVLPGFLNRPVRIVERSSSPPIDAQELIARSLERHTTPPDRAGVWHGSFEALWYFPNNVFAPIKAEAWLDPRSPARHRLQLSHSEGGAPYELQIGDGRRQLSYALDPAYAPVLYGALPTLARPGSPALIRQPLDGPGQLQARNARLLIGPWSIPPAYLRQARAATDLRLLGRQRDRDRVVQIVSFSGVSPLGLPPDAPGATAERVTVLLALDSEDGLLRSATELAGPTGGTQTSRVTWKLIGEQWLSTAEQMGAVFNIERAWNGIGGFDEARRIISADVALPLIGQWAVSDPVRLIDSQGPPIWIPSAPPPGIDRALLLWSDGDIRVGNPPQGLIYLGENRRLVMVFNRHEPSGGAVEMVGPWQVTISAWRTQRYRLTLSREHPPELLALGVFDPTTSMLIDAEGFTRAELVAMIATMRPFDPVSLAAQNTLFSSSNNFAPEQ